MAYRSFALFACNGGKNACHRCASACGGSSNEPHLPHMLGTGLTRAWLDYLIQAATCFNQLMLPPYETIDTMRAKLELAISETSGFGLK